MLHRCEWCGSEPIYVDYHDNEWGVPVHDDRRLFEMLILGGAQAGLSWIIILRKRNAYREAFQEFDAKRVAGYGESEIERLLENPGIVRNRLKIRSAIRNARAFLQIVREFGSFDQYIWQFVDHRPIQNQWRSLKEIPARSVESDAMSKDLKKRDFSFVGSAICYAFMQAVGMVNDHTADCFRHEAVKRMSGGE